MSSSKRWFPLRTDLRTFMVGLVAAAALGLLEAAWTGPQQGGPVHVWWGIAAIFVVLAAVTFPRV